MKINTTYTLNKLTGECVSLQDGGKFQTIEPSEMKGETVFENQNCKITENEENLILTTTKFRAK